MNALVWQTRALRQLRKIRDESTQERIFREVQTLRDFPNCTNVKRLVNHGYEYRLRVGDYRFFFNFGREEVHIVSIEEVRKRNERT